MKAPAQLNQLSVADEDFAGRGTYPPLGFRPVWNAELGNGDYFGLYWPYGREDREPMVCDMVHDQWGLEVAFSSVAIFVEWLEANGHDRGDAIVDDPAHPAGRFQNAKPLLRDRPKEAIEQLRKVADDFPEATDVWFTLASQRRRIGDQAGFAAAAIRAFASNWVFGFPPNGILKMLQSAKKLVDDPLVERSQHLTMQYAGTHDNSNYVLLRQCIAEYLESETPVLGLLLNQNYGYMMTMETVSFQERNQFDSETWLAEHRQWCLKHLGDSRTQIEP